MAVVLSRTADVRSDAMAVRRRVFVEEQGVSADLEYDGYDEDPAVDHFTAYLDGVPIGAARLRPLAEDQGKVERVAVLREWRGVGWGTRIMQSVHGRARDREFASLKLHAQRSVEGFYEALGYERTNDPPFEEAGIPHVAMERSLSAGPDQ